MKIRHNRPFSIAFIVVGILLILTAAATGELPVNFFTGGVLLLLGALMLANAMIHISPYEVKVKSPAGLTTGTYPVRYPGDLALRGKKLWHVPTNRKIATLGIAAHKPDVEQLRRMIETSGQGDYRPPVGADQDPAQRQFREQPQPDPYLGGAGWGGVPQHPGSLDTPTPHGQTPPPHEPPNDPQQP